MSKFCIQIDWDVPHLSPEAKLEIERSIPAYQRDARTKGIPQLGAGAIFQIAESELLVDPFDLPPHWPRAFGMDCGWQKTAAIFGCLDRQTDCLYLFSEHYRGEAEPVIHAEAIKARGAWIKGAIDPAARGRSQVDGRQLLQMYQDLGLNLIEADNAVESGLYELITRMTSGRLKVFRTLQNFIAEFRLYRRDEKGRVVKVNDHLCDSLRYLNSKLHEILSTAPAPKKQEPEHRYYSPGSMSTGWMG